MKENGVAYAYAAPPINDEDLADAVLQYEHCQSQISDLKKQADRLMDIIGGMFPNEAGEQFHYISSKRMKVVFKQSEIKKFDPKILAEIYPLGSNTQPDCMSIDYKVNTRQFDALPEDSDERKSLMQALTRKPGLRKIKVEYDDE